MEGIKSLHQRIRMPMKTITFQYKFSSPACSESFAIALDSRRLSMIITPPQSYPSWVDLDFCKCANCPLSHEKQPFCPLAAGLFQVVKGFDRTLSYHDIYLEVVTKERTICKHTTVQRAVSSLLGLVIATSGCPHTRFFRPMARFHLPLATEEETICRMTSMYLLAQYFNHKHGRHVDMDLRGLDQIYKNIHLVNTAVSRRLRKASETDSVVNALILLDLFAKALPWAIDDSLVDIEYLFNDYTSI